MMDAEPQGDDRDVEPDLAALVAASRAGDRSARGKLYERFGSYVHAIALSYADPDDAADLVQDAFVQAFDKIASLRDAAAFGPWIGQITRNLARMRRRQLLRLVSLHDQLPAAEPEARGGLDGDQVLAAIRSLPETYRETLMLRLVERLSGAEIARRTGMTHGSVRVNLHRGMALLRAKLGGAHE